MQVIADIGSTHMGKKEYIFEAIRLLHNMGCDVVKLQLFKGAKYTDKGNIPLPYELWPELCEYAWKIGQLITSSVFDEDAAIAVMKTKVPYVKLSYSMSTHNGLKKLLKTQKQRLMLSSDPMTLAKAKEETELEDVFLYCIPQYPVPYEVAFDGIFPTFKGFSDHTLGYRQTLRAKEAGAVVIEKHFCLDHADIVCPDAVFALRPREFDSMVRALK